MRTISKIFSLLFILMLLGCDDDALMPSSVDGQDAILSSKNQNKDDSFKATGDVEVTFFSNPGGHGNGNENILKEGKERFANVVFNAHEGDLKKEAKGNIEITMKNKAPWSKEYFLPMSMKSRLTLQPMKHDFWQWSSWMFDLMKVIQVTRIPEKSIPDRAV